MESPKGWIKDHCLIQRLAIRGTRARRSRLHALLLHWKALDRSGTSIPDSSQDRRVQSTRHVPDRRQTSVIKTLQGDVERSRGLPCNLVQEDDAVGRATTHGLSPADRPVRNRRIPNRPERARRCFSSTPTCRFRTMAFIIEEGQDFIGSGLTRPVGPRKGNAMVGSDPDRPARGRRTASETARTSILLTDQSMGNEEVSIWTSFSLSVWSSVVPRIPVQVRQPQPDLGWADRFSAIIGSWPRSPFFGLNLFFLFLNLMRSI